MFKALLYVCFCFSALASGERLTVQNVTGTNAIIDFGSYSVEIVPGIATFAFSTNCTISRDGLGSSEVPFIQDKDAVSVVGLNHSDLSGPFFVETNYEPSKFGTLPYERMAQGFAFVFLIGFLSLGARWMRNIIGGGDTVEEL